MLLKMFTGLKTMILKQSHCSFNNVTVTANGKKSSSVFWRDGDNRDRDSKSTAKLLNEEIEEERREIEESFYL